MPRFSLKSPKAVAVAAAATAIVFIALAAVLYVILAAPVHARPGALAKLKPEAQPRPVPAVAFADARGKRHVLGEFKGRYTLVNLWAPWCAPCVRELPALARLKAAVPPARLQVVAVNVGRSSAAATEAFLKAHQAGDLGVWRDTAVALVRGFRAYGLPTSILIDPQGKEIARAVGAADWGAPAAIAWFKTLPMPQPPTKPQPKPQPARPGA